MEDEKFAAKPIYRNLLLLKEYSIISLLLFRLLYSKRYSLLHSRTLRCLGFECICQCAKNALTSGCPWMHHQREVWNSPLYTTAAQQSQTLIWNFNMQTKLEMAKKRQKKITWINRILLNVSDKLFWGSFIVYTGTI